MWPPLGTGYGSTLPDLRRTGSADGSPSNRGEGPGYAAFRGGDPTDSALWELRRRKAYDRLHLVFGTLADKDSEGIAAALYPLADRLIATEAPTNRATPADELLEIASQPPHRASVPDPREALDRARQAAAPEDLICICGSTYLIGALRPLLVES